MHAAKPEAKMWRYFVGVSCSAALIVCFALAAPAAAQQKTAKECNDQWTANKATIQASGKKKKDFMAECRGTSQAAAPPAQAAAPTTPAPATTAQAVKPPKAAAAGAPTGAGQFTSDTQAKARCPADTVVWVNLDSKIYHYSGTKDYGHTKSGAYMCEKDTAGQGFRAAKNEKRPVS
jgi:hypothetical protein